jgi:putative colanic acid biosynthesis acetyltransferase WcaF
MRICPWHPFEPKRAFYSIEPMTLATAPPARNVSPWTTRHKVGRLLWAVTYALVFRRTFHNWYGLRAAILRRFGARVGRNVRVRRTARIEIPWNLTLGDDVSIGDEAILYSLGPVTVGARSFLSQYAHLCAGTHDGTRSDYPLIRAPITVGEDCWIAADAFVGPGVSIGDRTIIGARASVFSDIPPDVIAVGNPAKPIKPRQFTRVEQGK